VFLVATVVMRIGFSRINKHIHQMVEHPQAQELQEEESEMSKLTQTAGEQI
jgi:hypothetical protein